MSNGAGKGVSIKDGTMGIVDKSHSIDMSRTVSQIISEGKLVLDCLLNSVSR